jgi:hypothetical protein
MTKKKEAPAEEAPAETTETETASEDATSEGEPDAAEEEAPAEDEQDPNVNDQSDPGDEDPENLEEAIAERDDAPLPLPNEVKAALENEYPLLGRKRDVPAGHGSHDAAVSGYTTDASGAYTPPGMLPKE